MAKHRSRKRNNLNGQQPRPAPYPSGAPGQVPNNSRASQNQPAWIPPPYDPTNPPPAITHPTGTNAPNFSQQNKCDGVGLSTAIALRFFFAREKNPNQVPPPPKDGDMDPKTLLRKLESEIRKSSSRRPYFPGMSKTRALIVVKCAQKQRNATQHNDLPLIKSNLHIYLSAVHILVGPRMVNSPQALAVVRSVLQQDLLTPLALSSLPKRPK